MHSSCLVDERGVLHIWRFLVQPMRTHTERQHVAYREMWIIKIHGQITWDKNKIGQGGPARTKDSYLPCKTAAH